MLLLLACVSSDPSKNTGDSVPDTTETGHVRVEMVTSLGTLELDINGADAPISAANFLSYVDDGFYDGADGSGATVFHRVVQDFVIQGGGYTEDGTEKTTKEAIALETDVGLSNVRGSLAMARTPDPNSATSQFYINLVDNTFLDGTGQQDGYAVFGAVSAGLDVVDAIGAAQVAGEQPVDGIVITACARK
jgi:cyclophilin family peptidyl-prolyl cis-trans isomerase